MPGLGDDETLLDKRRTELGLARTVALPIKATITPRMLAATEVAPAPSAAPAAAAPHRDPAADLPRISVDERIDVTSPAPAALAGRPRRDYGILGTIGEGGMGRVHLARQRSLDRDVALKTLKPGAPPAVAEALLREARLTGSLEHPGVIPVHALGLDETGRPMLVMKRVDGVDFAALLADPAHPTWRAGGRSPDRLVASLEILVQVCLTLEFAHSRRIVHRDVKPENVMVGAFGEVVLLDWGIATPLGADDPTAFVGTPAYMAPEMALGRPVDARTDVYLLGATLHEAVTGRCRHDGAGVAEVVRRAVESAPVDYGPDVPEELARICNRATARDPAERHASVEELREDITAFLRHRGARALCDAALARVSALERALAAAPGSAPPANVAEAYRLATEGRFGLVQSLREHPTDEAGRAGMRRCLAAAVDLELRQGHADSADALLQEMKPPDPELARRVAEVRARLAERDRERERLARLDRDLDPTEQAGARTRHVAVLSALFLAVAVGVTSSRARPTPVMAVTVTAVLTVVLGVALLVLRRRLLTNAFNRRIAAVLVFCLAGVTAHRLVNLSLGASFEDMVTVDLVLLTAMTGSAAIALTARLWFAVAILAVAAAATRAWPGLTVPIFAFSTAGALMAAGLLLGRARRMG
jgi:serine/threonine-protein kinase